MNPLARIDMKSKLKGQANVNNSGNTSGYFKTPYIGSPRIDEGNLTGIESQLVSDLIQGEKRAEEVNTSYKILTWDEAVANIKK